MRRLLVGLCAVLASASAMAVDADWRTFVSQGETVVEGNVSSLDLSGIFPTMWVRMSFPADENGLVRMVGQFEFDCDDGEIRLMSEQGFAADGELLIAREHDEDERNWVDGGAGTVGAPLMRYVCEAELMEQ